MGTIVGRCPSDYGAIVLEIKREVVFQEKLAHGDKACCYKFVIAVTHLTRISCIYEDALNDWSRLPSCNGYRKASRDC